MKYFIELLESYSRLKKRTLRLLEKNLYEAIDNQAQSLGDAAIAQAQQTMPDPNNPQVQLPKYTQNNPFTPPSAKKPIKMWQTQEGIVYWDNQSAPNGSRGFQVNSDPDRFYSNFGDASVAQEEGGEDVASGGEGGQILSSAAKYGSWPGMSIISKIFKIQGKVPGLLRSIVKKERNNATSLEILDFAKGLHDQLRAGDHNGSWAKALWNSVTIIRDEDGTTREYDLSTGEEMKDLKLEVQDRLERAIDLAIKENPTPEECQELKRTVVRLSGGRIAIKQPLNGYSGRGVVFNDRSKRLSILFNGGSKVNGCGELDKVSTGDLNVNDGESNRIRGDFMESVEEFTHIIRGCDVYERGTQEYRDCFRRAGNIIEKWRNERDKLNRVFESVARLESEFKNSEGSMPIDVAKEIETINAMKEIFGENAPEMLVRKLTMFAGQEHTIRRPEYLLRVGAEVGEGKRADTLEIYTTKKAAFEALRRQGFEDDRIRDLIVEKNIREACAAATDRLSCPEDLNRNYFTVGISLKNYLNLKKGVHLGGRTKQQIDSVLQGKDCKSGTCTPEERRNAKNLRKAMATTLGQLWMADTNSPQYKEMMQLSEEIERMESAVDSLGEIETKTNNGKKISKNSLSQMATTYIEDFASKNDFNQQIKHELVVRLREYIREGKNPEEVKAMLAHELKMKMLTRKMSQDGTKGLIARSYIAGNAFLSGGSSDNTVASVRALESSESFIFEQNQAYSLYKEWINNPTDKNKDGGPRWVFTTGRTVSLRDTTTGARISASAEFSSTGSVTIYATTNHPNIKTLSKIAKDQPKPEIQQAQLNP